MFFQPRGNLLSKIIHSYLSHFQPMVGKVDRNRLVFHGSAQYNEHYIVHSWIHQQVFWTFNWKELIKTIWIFSIFYLCFRYCKAGFEMQVLQDGGSLFLCWKCLLLYQTARKLKFNFWSSDKFQNFYWKKRIYILLDCKRYLCNIDFQTLFEGVPTCKRRIIL